jgi:glycosyltransferase involved in cell wall biosynthesis
MQKDITRTICLNMIVKNESKIIERCLKSVYHLIDSWCIVDTGSTDGTQEIIKNFLKDKPGVLHEKPWVNFGHNRNEALALARTWSQWTLLTDADMVLVDKGFKKEMLDPSADVYDLMQDNCGTCYNNMRILNNRLTWRCVGVTHEYYDTIEGVNSRRLIQSDILYFDDISDGGSKSDKFERDIKLLTQGLIDEPDNARYMFYLAQSYRDTGEYDKAIEWYDKRVKAGGWDEEVWFAQYMVGWCMNAKNDSYENCAAALMKAWIMRPWRTEPVWMLGMMSKNKKMWPQAYQLLKVCATTEWPKDDVLFILKSAYGYTTIDEFAVAAYWAGKHQESAGACINLLNDETVPKEQIPRIKKNLWFSQKAMGVYSEENLQKYINEKKTTI